LRPLFEAKTLSLPLSIQALAAREPRSFMLISEIS